MESKSSRRLPCPNNCCDWACKASDKAANKVNLDNHFFVWIYGAPSSGKTTQIDMICKQFGMTRLNAGDLIKEKMAQGSMRARCLRDAMDRGELVPTNYVVDLLKTEILNRAAECRGFVIDGYPREKDQGNIFESKIAPVDAFIFLDIERDTLMQRHAARAIAKLPKWQLFLKNFKYQSGTMQLNIFYKYHTEIMKMYRKKIIRVSGVNKTPEKIFAEIEPIIKQAIARKRSQIIAREVNIRRAKLQESKSSTVGNQTS